MSCRCIWCLETEQTVSFDKKAHTIPKSLGGQNFNNNVCDSCNEYFGNRNSIKEQYSIEEALKETFNVTRRRFLLANSPKRKVGRFKSKYFEIKERNGKFRLVVKPSFSLSPSFQTKICRSFKRGLFKMFLEELNRQKGLGYEESFSAIRDFARYDVGDLPVFYFTRKYGVILMLEREAETPELMFDRMHYLFSNEKYVEIEFLGHVFGFPITEFDIESFEQYAKESASLKREHFTGAIAINRLIDVDLILNILNK